MTRKPSEFDGIHLIHPPKPLDIKCPVCNKISFEKKFFPMVGWVRICRECGNGKEELEQRKKDAVDKFMNEVKKGGSR